MNLKSKALAVAAAGMLLAGAAAQAQTVDTMNFNGVNEVGSTKNGAEVLTYYDGGASSVNQTGGPNYGVSFGTDGEAESSTYSKKNFTNNPSGASTLYFAYLSSTNSSFTAYNSMNVAGGFTALSFNYASSGAYNSSGSGTPSVALYSGVNGTGTLLGTINLSINDGSGDGCGANSYCVWTAASSSLASGQVAESAVFSSASEYTYFDSVAITTAAAVPEPSAFALAAAGLAVVGGAVRVRRRRS